MLALRRLFVGCDFSFELTSCPITAVPFSTATSQTKLALALSRNWTLPHHLLTPDS
jgi:hypothetical protein